MGLHTQDNAMKLIVFTDLDGTLLDHHTYSWQAAAPALEALAEKGVPLILCSSKTRSEMLVLWQKLGLGHPFITENGGGIFAPEDNPVTETGDWQPAGPGWCMITLGRPVAELRAALDGFKEQTGARGFGDMTDAEVADLTGLELESAALARKREFNEPVLLADPERDAEAFIEASRKAGLQATRGGRFFHLLGGGGKGKAVRLLSSLYREQNPELETAALGDSANDLPMLLAVDHAFQVALHDGSHADLEGANIQRVPLIGPQGWNQAVLDLLGCEEGA